MNTAPELTGLWLHEPCPTGTCPETATFGPVRVSGASTHESVYNGERLYHQYHALLHCPRGHENDRMVGRYFPDTGEVRLYDQGTKRQLTVTVLDSCRDTRGTGVLVTMPTGAVAIGARGGEDVRARTKVFADRALRGRGLEYTVQYARFSGRPSAESLPAGTVHWFPNLSAFLAAYAV